MWEHHHLSYGQKHKQWNLAFVFAMPMNITCPADKPDAEGKSLLELH